MRINKYVAQATGMSRRKADEIIANGRVTIDSKTAGAGDSVAGQSTVRLDNKPLKISNTTTIMFNKPVGYVCSRDGQGSKTVYELLPATYHKLKPVGRLDKDSSGLLLLTDDGQLAHELTHPRFEKTKRYIVQLDKELSEADFEIITKKGVVLEDGMSKFELNFVNDQNYEWKVTMHEGRNRQIRRTFEALGYQIVSLHRTHFGNYTLGSLALGEHKNTAQTYHFF